MRTEIERTIELPLSAVQTLLDEIRFYRQAMSGFNTLKLRFTVNAGSPEMCDSILVGGLQELEELITNTDRVLKNNPIAEYRL